MDGLIKTAWRVFWVFLGASGVLITQSLLSPEAKSPRDADASAARMAPPSYDGPVSSPRLADPFDKAHGRVVVRVRDES